MPDIFDQITVEPEKKDIFDQISQPKAGKFGRAEFIQQASPKSPIQKFFDKLKGVFGQSPEERIAISQNIYAISKTENIPWEEVEKNYDKLIRDPKITGIKPSQITNEEFTALVFAPLIGTAALSAPVTTAVSLASFAALDKMINLSDFVPSDANDATKTAVELIDFTVKGGVVGGGVKKGTKAASGLIEKYLQTKMTQMKLPEVFKLTRNQVADIFKTGKLTTKEQRSIFAGLGLDRKQVLESVRKGVEIEVPGEKIIQFKDKPGWASFKKFVGAKPLAEKFPRDPILQSINQERIISTETLGFAKQKDVFDQITFDPTKDLKPKIAVEAVDGPPLVEPKTPTIEPTQPVKPFDVFDEVAKAEIPTSPTITQPEIVQPGASVEVKSSTETPKTGEKAVFKINKKASVWGVPMEAKGPNAKVKTKKITAEKVQQIYQDTLTDIEFSEEGDFIVIKGYPKKELSKKEMKSFSQYGSVGETVEGLPQETATVELKPIETIEMVRLAKDLMGKAPTTRKYPSSFGKFYPKEGGSIGLNRELFKRGNEKQLSSTLAHEIGHLIDYLPEQDLKRGNMYGHLLSLRKYLKEKFGDNLVTNKELRQELIKLSRTWKPLDEAGASKAFIQYRNSSVELYADFVSVLFNNPGLAKKESPKAFELFFEGLDKKLDAKQAYFDIQDLLSGTPAEVIERREQDIREMFVKGEELREQKRKEKELAKVNTWERIRQLVDDVNFPIISKRRKAESKGQFLPPESSPEYQLEERSLVDNDNFLMMYDIDTKVNKELTAIGLTDDDLGMYLFLKRVQGRPELPLQGDLQTPMEELMPFSEQEAEQMKKVFFDVPGRKDIANPLGFDPKTASIQMKALSDKIGAEKFAAVERIARDFQEIIWPIFEEAVKVGAYNKKTFETIIKPNKGYYVTFGVLNYLQNHVPATVKMQKGTLQDIENPFITTVLKMVSLNRLNARQRAVNQLRNWLKGSFADEIVPAKKDIKGNFIKPGYDSGLELIHLLEDGKLAAYQVDQYIAKSVENSKNGDVMLVGHLINKVFGNQIFKNLYITYNPGFAFAFNPIRDFKRTYANLNAVGQKVSVLNLLSNYAQALPTAIKRQRGIDDSILRKMLSTKALDVPFIDFNFDIHGDDYNGILKQLKVLGGEEHIYQRLMKPVLRPLLVIMEGIRFSGSVLESLSKISGYNILKNDPSLGEKQIAYITRNYIGTPNYRRGGTITSTTNAVFMFSNIMKEGLKTDLQLATHPKTKSGFWWSHFKVNLLPKFLMIAAGAGWLGKELKDMFDGMSEYDKTNYITVPLGKDSNGKTVYWRLPHDESGRLMAAVLWKTAMGINDKDPKQLQQIFAFGAGQLPGLAPGIELSTGWLQYLSGKNPYDNFRGQYIVSDTEWKAGGIPALKKMVQWTTNNSGLLQFATYSDDNQSTFESTIRVLPGINRLIKVSNYGKTESLRKNREQIEKEQSQRTLKKRELIGKAVERMDRGDNINKLSREIAGKLYDKPTPEQWKNIRTGIKQEKERGKNVYIDMIMTARTNEEKDLILREMRQMYDAQRMREMEREILRVKAASPEVIRKSRR